MSVQKLIPYLGDIKVEKLIDILQKGPLKPRYDPGVGYHYPEAEEILEKDPKETTKFLNELVEVGILEKKLYGRDVICPHDGSFDVGTTYSCPYCNSIELFVNSLVEHVSCGNIDTKTNFSLVGEGTRKCPKCGITVKESGLRNVGSWFECASCKRRVSEPLTVHTCRVCGKRFGKLDVKFGNIYAYELNPKIADEIKSGFGFATQITSTLRKFGYEPEFGVRMQGQSGVPHHFDLVAKAGNFKLVFDIVTSDSPVNEEKVVSFFAKVFDTNIVQRSFLIVKPSLSEQAKKLAQLYKLNILEIPDGNVTSRLLEQKLVELKFNKPSKEKR
jgi:hypothetical protein